MGWVLNATPQPLYHGKDPVTIVRRLGGSQGRSGHVWKISPAPEFDSQTVQSVASRYTDWAIPAPPYRHLFLWAHNFFFFFCLRNLIYFCGQQSFVGSFLLKISLCSSLGLSTLIYSRYAELRRAVAAGKCRNPTWRTANMECCLVPKYKSELELLLVF